MKGYVTQIERDTRKNADFRRVLYTGKHSQLVLMSLEPGEEIGEETHKDVDQFFRFEGGEGKVFIDGVEHRSRTGVGSSSPRAQSIMSSIPLRARSSDYTPFTLRPSTKTAWSAIRKEMRWRLRNTLTDTAQNSKEQPTEEQADT